MWRGLILLMLCAQLCACALFDARHSGGTDVAKGDISVASDAMLTLLPATTVLHNVTLTQRIDASYAKAGEPTKTHSFIVQIEAGANDMRMVGLAPMGVQLFAVTLNGTELAVDVPPYLSLPFDPRFMLADMQLALADVKVLNAHLAGAQIRMATDARRELVSGDNVRMRIDYQRSNGGKACDEGSELRIEHLERHYQIKITTLACAPYENGF